MTHTTSRTPACFRGGPQDHGSAASRRIEPEGDCYSIRQRNVRVNYFDGVNVTTIPGDYGFTTIPAGRPPRDRGHLDATSCELGLRPHKAVPASTLVRAANAMRGADDESSDEVNTAMPNWFGDDFGTGSRFMDDDHSAADYADALCDYDLGYGPYYDKGFLDPSYLPV